MDDYISREAAIEAISEECKLCAPSGNCPFIMNCLIKQKRKVLNSVPPADVRPVVRGKWEEIAIIPDAYDIFGVVTWASEMRCQKCGFTTYAIEGRFLQYNFCPNCWAKMGGQP